jgi:hypothetical protein
MELLDEEGQISLDETQDQVLLNKNTVDRIAELRGDNLRMGVCDDRKKDKSAWEPILEERNRRRQGNEGTVMQRVMELKKRKNLETKHGNSFAALGHENLLQLSKDVNLKFGNDLHDASNIVGCLVNNEVKNFEKFVDENPEILLPANLDLESHMDNHEVENNGSQVEDMRHNDSLKEDIIDNAVETPAGTLEDPETSPLWTEVVTRGRYKKKSTSKRDKINSDDRCSLKY